MRIGVRLGPLWLSERLPDMKPPGWRQILLLAILVALAYILQVY